MSVIIRRTINMESQQCNYCKGSGHRIHKIDTFGQYILGQDGQRLLACPVLLSKEKRTGDHTAGVKDEFPPLVSTSSSASSSSNWTKEVTARLPASIAAANKEAKQKEWEVRQAKKAEMAEKARVAKLSPLELHMETSWQEYISEADAMLLLNCSCCTGQHQAIQLRVEKGAFDNIDFN